MVTRDGRVVLLDFGIITELTSHRSSFRNVAVAGTPAYMAPEQLAQDYAPTPASDFYALGILLFEALAGYPPFRGDTSTVLEAKRVLQPPDVGAIAQTAPAALINLCRDLMQTDPRLRPSGEQILRLLGDADPDSALDAASTFVGRETESAQLQQALQSLIAGSGGAILLRGVSGVGKSALMEHFLTTVHARGDVVVLSSRCFESESVPYKTFDSLVDSLYHHLHAQSRDFIAARMPDDAGALAIAFPILQQLESFSAAVGAAGSSLQGSELQRRAFAALLQLLTRLSQDGPLLLYVDDLQWGDMDSLPLVLRLMRKSSRRILLIASYRAEEEHKSPVLKALKEQLQSSGESLVFSEITLDALPQDAVERLVRSMIGADDAPELVQTIVRESRGHPYLAHELARYAGSHGNALSETVMSLERVIRARLQQLSDSAQELLRVVVVAGFPLTNLAAQTAAQLGPGQRGAFKQLRAGRFIRSNGTRASDLVQPYHDRIRETLVAQLSSEESQRLHLRIAQVLDSPEGEGEQTLYALAQHYFFAHSAAHHTRTFALNFQAAQLAARSYAYAQSYAFLEQAAQVAEQHRIAMPIEFLQLHADVSARTGRAAQANALYDRGLSQALLPADRVRLRIGLARLSMTQLDTKEVRLRAFAALKEIGEEAPRRGLSPMIGALRTLRRGLKMLHDPAIFGSVQGADRLRTRQLVAIYDLIAGAAYFEMDNLSMVQSLLRMTVPVALLGPSRELSDWHRLLGVVCAVVNRRTWSLHNAARAIEVAQQIHDQPALALAYEFRAHTLNILGEPRQAEASMLSCLDGSGHLLENSDFLTAVADYAWITMMRGYAARGFRAIADGLERVRADSRNKLTEGHTYRCYAGPLLAQLGRADEGAAHLDRFKQFLDTTPPEPWRTASYFSHRVLFCALIEDDAGLDAALAAHAALRLHPGRARLQLRQIYVGQAMARVRQFERANPAERRNAEKRARKALEDLKKAGKHPSLRAQYHVLFARLQRLRGQTGEIEAALASAVQLAEAHDNPWVLYEVAIERAQRFAVAGRTSEMIAQLDVAERLAETHGWPPRKAAVERLRSRLTATKRDS